MMCGSMKFDKDVDLLSLIKALGSHIFHYFIVIG